MKQLMYFAHCYLEYPNDDKYMDIIKENFEDQYEFINPKIFGFQNMPNYMKIMSACDALVFHPFENKIITAGMKQEIELAYRMGKYVVFINEQGTIDVFTPDTMIKDFFAGWKVLGVTESRQMMRALVEVGKYPRPKWWIKK